MLVSVAAFQSPTANQLSELPYDCSSHRTTNYGNYIAGLASCPPLRLLRRPPNKFAALAHPLAFDEEQFAPDRTQKRRLRHRMWLAPEASRIRSHAICFLPAEQALPVPSYAIHPGVDAQSQQSKLPLSQPKPAPRNAQGDSTRNACDTAAEQFAFGDGKSGVAPPTASSLAN